MNKGVVVLTHEEMVGLQAEKHELIDAFNFRTKEEYVLHLIHSYPYSLVSKLAENKTILDLGCNTGYGSKILSKTAKRVVGVDVSENAISISKKTYSHLNIEFRLIDGKQLPFADNEFDMIISCQVIEHIVDYNIYLNEVKRVLSPSGVVFFTTPNALLRLDPGMKPWNPFHVREFNHSELEELLVAHFSAVKVMGLATNKTLSLIEINRVNKSREAARISQQLNHNQNHLSIKSALKKILPKFIFAKIKVLRKSLAHSNKLIDNRFIEKYGLNDIFFHSDNLSNALDLLAICSDDADILEDIKKNIKAT